MATSGTPQHARWLRAACRGDTPPKDSNAAHGKSTAQLRQEGSGQEECLLIFTERRGKSRSITTELNLIMKVQALSALLILIWLGKS
jgi:hypothetical protein